MKTFVVTEGEVDAAILEGILGAVLGPEALKVVSAGSRSRAVSLARSYLAVRESPVALVLDADMTDEARIREEELNLTELLAFAGARERFGVFLAVPTMEIVFFPTQEASEEVLGKSLSENEWEAAQYRPKDVLWKLLGGKQGSLPAITELLKGRSAHVLAEGPLMKRLAGFISQHASAQV